MNDPAPAPAAPPSLRGLRIALLALQSLVAAFLLLLCAVGAIGPLRERVFALVGYGSHAGAAAWAAGLALAFIFAAAGAFGAGWRLQARSWGRIAAGLCAAALALAWLARDDPALRHPVTLEELSPAFPGAERSYAVLMQYGKDHPLGRGFKAPMFKDPFPSLTPDKPEAWRTTVLTRRAEFEAHWAALAPQRAWWAELAAFDRIADLMPARLDGEVISFQVFRSLSQNGLAIASLQALDGRGDDAVDTLLPILGVGRRLQPYSRALVRQMIGVVIEHMALSTASFVLDNSQPSPPARARLAAALQGGDPAGGARHLFLTEYALSLGSIGGSPAGDVLERMGTLNHQPALRCALNLLSPFLYTPRATFNRLGDLYAGWGDGAAGRRPETLDAGWKAFFADTARPSPRNLLGRWVGIEMTPAYGKVAESYWRNQDQRAALLARLSRP